MNQTQLLRSTATTWVVRTCLVALLATAAAIGSSTLAVAQILVPAELLATNCGVASGFAIDGNIVATGANDDWATGVSGVGVLLSNGAPNPVRLPAFWHRDGNWGTGVDPSTFSKEAKNNDNIAAGFDPYEYGSGSGPQKNDLTDTYAHARVDGNGDVWLIMGAATRATNGDSHVDFEFNQAGVSIANGFITGLGASNGRTVGDFIISIDYLQGGRVPVDTVRIWTGTSFEFVPTPPGNFVCANDIDVPAGPWGAIDPNGNPTTTQTALQFVEAGINLTAGGLIPPEALCKATSFLTVKTRASGSFTAALKDFDSWPFIIVQPPDVHAGADGVINCTTGPQITLTGTSTSLNATFSWAASNGGHIVSGGTTLTPTVDAAGTYTLTADDNGCTASDVALVTVNTTPPNVEAGIAKVIDCLTPGLQIALSGSSSTVGATFNWVASLGGHIVSGGTTPTPTVDAAGTYTLTVTDPSNGCTASDATTVTVNLTPPACSLTAPEPLPQCGQQSNDLCTTALPAGAIYVWSILNPAEDGWAITGGQGTNCIKYTAGNGGTTGLFKVDVTDPTNGCTNTCRVSFTCIGTQRFCTLTQGAYGNSNGVFNGMRRLELIQSLITATNPLVVGKTTAQTVPTAVPARSLTFPDGAEQCIIDRLPAGGPAVALPELIGNATIDGASSCTNSLLKLNKNGRFTNVFLGQVITLSLNKELDENLPGLTICQTMVTYRSITGPDGKPMQDPLDLTGKTITIPARIFTALADPLILLPKTVGGLLSLANLGLAGQYTGVATIGDLNTAVSSINEGFDECRFMGKCLDGEIGPGVVGGSGEYVDESAAAIALPVEFGLSASMPNPFSNLTTIRLSLPERSSVQLSVYNILGQEVARLADGELSAGIQSVQWNAASRSGNPVAPGVYFFRVRAHSLESGRAFTRTQKVLFIK